MQRRKPMKPGNGFRATPKPARPCKAIEYTPKPRTPAQSAVAAGCSPARPKQAYVRNESYRRWVAALPCAHCGIEGYSQCAHADDNGAGGKGMGIKASDSTCYPACGPRLGEPGCHWLIGSSGTFTRAERRQLEAEYSKATLAAWVEKSA